MIYDYIPIRWKGRMSTYNELYPVSFVELTYRNPVKPSLRPQISSCHDVYNILLQAWDDNKLEFVEEFKVLLLNRAARVLGIYEVSKGGVSGTVVDPKLVFIAALKANASSIVLAHNHPSGNLAPSISDKVLTTKLTDAGHLLDIQVLDHLIITSEGYYSFTEQQSYNPQ